MAQRLIESLKMKTFSKLHNRRHLQLSRQLVRILVLSPEIEQTENLQLHAGKSGLKSPSIV